MCTADPVQEEYIFSIWFRYIDLEEVALVAGFPLFCGIHNQRLIKGASFTSILLEKEAMD
jgi:hypothetical protein